MPQQQQTTTPPDPDQFFTDWQTKQNKAPTGGGRGSPGSSATPPAGAPDPDAFLANWQAQQSKITPPPTAQPAEIPPEQRISAYVNPRTGQRPTLAPNQLSLDAREQGIEKGILATAGSMLAPELLPAGAGLITRALASGVGGMAGTSTGQALTGQNPVTAPSLREAGTTGLATGITDLAFGAIPALVGSKLGRQFINQSLEATAKDVTYGNPARAMGDVYSIRTGDWEKFKAALRGGASLGDAEKAAGGRFADISGKINRLAPKVDAAVNASTHTVPVAAIVDRPLMDAVQAVIDNGAITATDKNAIVSQLGEFQQALHSALANPQGQMTMADALRLKRDIGNEVSNWLAPPRNEIQEAYRAVYGSLKNALHNGVPGVAALDEQLTDALAAQDALKRLVKNEEVGRGAGPLRGSMGVNLRGQMEALVGKVLPGVGGGSKVLQTAGKVAVPQVTTGGGRGNPSVIGGEVGNEMSRLGLPPLTNSRMAATISTMMAGPQWRSMDDDEKRSAVQNLLGRLPSPPRQ